MEHTEVARYMIKINEFDWYPNAPIEYARTLAEAKKTRTRMARGTGLPPKAIIITRLENS